MRSEKQLKERLRQMDFERPTSFEESELTQLLKEMTMYIGSTDGELRDQLIYTCFYRLIERDYVSTEQMLFLLDTCIDDNHLFFCIGGKNDDSVFTRAFSSLVLALIMDKDRNRSFIPEDKVKKTIDACLCYLDEEQDTRGYVEGKGWAHSIAHGADFLAETIKHPAFTNRFHQRTLKVIKTCLFKEAAYIDDEDGRLLFAIDGLIEDGLSVDVLLEWTKSLSTTVNNRYRENGFSLSFFREKTNIGNFLKTFYFRLKWKGAGSEIRNHIESTLEKWHRHDFS